MEGPSEQVDKSLWARGPWDAEPDRVEFRHAGLPCLMLRHPRLGCWCGYAAVPPGHPLHGKPYDDADVEVHGGLTYADKCAGDICHVPKPGEPDDVWWFGFDCGHFMDAVPGMVAWELAHGFTAIIDNSVYRDAAYVRAEVQRLAEQLANPPAKSSPTQEPSSLHTEISSKMRQ